jgi:hypothetical protein
MGKFKKKLQATGIVYACLPFHGGVPLTKMLVQIATY